MDNKIKNFVEKMFTAFHIPYHFFQLPCDSWEWVDLGLRQGLIGKKEADKFWQNFFSRRNEEKTIYHFVDLFEFTYYLALFPEDGGRLVIGPLIYDIMPDKNITKLLEHCHMPHLYTTIKALYQKLTPVSDAFPNIIQLLADTLYGESNWRILSERSDSSSEFIELSNSRFQMPGRRLNTTKK